MDYLIFGTGDYFRRYIHWFRERNVIALIDNDKQKQGTIIEGYPVLSPEEAITMKYDAIVVLSFYLKEIKNQLVNLGVEEKQIYHFYDLHDLFEIDNVNNKKYNEANNINKKKILLLSHDLTLGGPSLALFHAAVILRNNGYDICYASMLDGELRQKLDDELIPVMVDRRLQICTMKELPWTWNYDLIICNTINYNVFLTERDTNIPVIWWLHDCSFYYEGLRANKLVNIDNTNMKFLSVGSIPRDAMNIFRPNEIIEDLIYGVSYDA